MNKIFNYLRTNSDFTIGVAMIITVVCYGFYRHSLMERNGVITIARVDKFEGAEQGADLYGTVFLNNKEYKSILNMFCQGCIGNFYFIKVLPTHPESGGQLYEDEPAASCFLDNMPSGGWKEIPKGTCE